jgi:hypothetical protein
MKLYLVRWLHDYYYLETPFKGGAPVCPAKSRLMKAFTDPLAAERYRQEVECGIRTPPPQANPFHGFREYFIEGRRLQKLTDLTSFPEPIFADWLMDCNLTPPKLPSSGELPRRDWADWWDANAPRMTDYQRARIWQALDKLRFFEIVETEWEV